VSSRTHLAHVSTLSSPSIIHPISGQLSGENQRRSQPSFSGFLLPFGHRHSLLGPSHSRWGTQPSSQLAYPAQTTAPGPHRDYHVPLYRDPTGVGAAYIPGTAMLSRLTGVVQPAPAALLRPVPPPRCHIPSTGLSLMKHHRQFMFFTRPVFPLPVTPGWNRSPSAFPRASHPAVTSDACQGRRQALSTGPGLHNRHPPASNLRVHSHTATSCRTPRRLLWALRRHRTRVP
jgi:hypothetical protein